MAEESAVNYWDVSSFYFILTLTITSKMLTFRYDVEIRTDCFRFITKGCFNLLCITLQTVNEWGRRDKSTEFCQVLLLVYHSTGHLGYPKHDCRQLHQVLTRYVMGIQLGR
jgi:hypothetical protein